MDVNANIKNGIQKILQQKLKKVENGDDIAKDIQQSVEKLVFPNTTPTNKGTQDDIQGFFTDIQDGVRELQTDTNQQKNLEKVQKQSPEQFLNESFLDEFDQMVEEVQDKYDNNKKMKPLIESYKKTIKGIKGSILKESKNEETNKTREEMIVQCRYQTNTFFESHGLNSRNLKYHDYLESVTDQQFNYLQNEGKRLIIEESNKILKPYFKGNRNRFKIKSLIREGFEPVGKLDPAVTPGVDTTQQNSTQIEPVEYQEEIPPWKDEVMMDDYDFQFMFLNYLDNNENLVISNNPEFEEKLNDLQASLYNNTNDLQNGWENETGISQELTESDLFGENNIEDVLNMISELTPNYLIENFDGIQEYQKWIENDLGQLGPQFREYYYKKNGYNYDDLKSDVDLENKFYDEMEELHNTKIEDSDLLYNYFYQLLSKPEMQETRKKIIFGDNSIYVESSQKEQKRESKSDFSYIIDALKRAGKKELDKVKKILEVPDSSKQTVSESYDVDSEGETMDYRLEEEEVEGNIEYVPSDSETDEYKEVPVVKPKRNR